MQLIMVMTMMIIIIIYIYYWFYCIIIFYCVFLGKHYLNVVHVSQLEKDTVLICNDSKLSSVVLICALSSSFLYHLHLSCKLSSIVYCPLPSFSVLSSSSLLRSSSVLRKSLNEMPSDCCLSVLRSFLHWVQLCSTFLKISNQKSEVFIRCRLCYIVVSFVDVIRFNWMNGRTKNIRRHSTDFRFGFKIKSLRQF